MTPATDNQFDSDKSTAERRGHLGVRHSLARCSESVVEGDVDLMFIAYTENVLWLRGLHDFYRREVGDYELRRLAHPGGRALGALCLVRDKAIHQLVTFHEPANKTCSLQPGPAFPDGRIPVWLKSSRTTLQVFREKSDREKMSDYDVLAGLPLVSTLMTARDFLFFSARSGPWPLEEPPAGW